jgi:hypothetical protein
VVSDPLNNSIRKKKKMVLNKIKGLQEGQEKEKLNVFVEFVGLRAS